MKSISMIKEERFTVDEHNILVITGTAHSGKSTRLKEAIVHGHNIIFSNNNRVLVTPEGLAPYIQDENFMLLLKEESISYVLTPSVLFKLEENHDVYIDNLGLFLSQLGYHMKPDEMLEFVIKLFKDIDNLTLKAVTIQAHRLG